MPHLLSYPALPAWGLGPSLSLALLFCLETLDTSEHPEPRGY